MNRNRHSITEDRVFGLVMRDVSICKKLLDILLQEDVGEITVPETEKFYKEIPDGRAIRLDVLTRDSGENFFNLEMQNRGGRTPKDLALPKRVRFYRSLIDAASIRTGTDYRDFKEITIIFICTFDPFGYGHYEYRISSGCRKDPELEYDEGVTVIFYNVKSTEAMPEDMRALFNYIRTGEATDEFTRQIEEKIVGLDKNIEETGMKELIVMMDAKREGREEGRLEGEKAGLEKGRALESRKQEEKLKELLSKGIISKEAYDAIVY